ncbi:SDR family NAD(P)-dependent oxidoreductase [uncultured Hymenobacter sp.]|uniref:SDR family NAD(P)-dependent oxidoreductase n=1 Tax=uncultured Hymenobacter sp. TaxID=170016 RepID=UPI0035C94B73
MTPRFQNKTVLVTGGSTGIGLATAARLLAEGATVFITGRRRAELDEALAQLGDRAIAVQGDITSHADLTRLFATIQDRAGHLDAVVANAGGGSLVPLGQYTDELLDERFAINVKGTAFTVQEALPLMGRGGSIVLIGSISGLSGMAGLGIYGATKAGLRLLARTWSTELKERGIRVNVVSPGIFITEAYTAAGITEANYDSLLPSIPMGRLGKVEEVAGVIAFAASDDSSYMTGTEIVVDGGLTQV